MKTLDTRELARLMNKCWMTHDGMWFFHCLQELGIEKTNKLNKAAISSLAPIETKRLLKAFDLGRMDRFDDVKKLFEAAEKVFIPDFMGHEITYPTDNGLQLVVQKCFAYEGISRMGAIDRYECGIFHRIESWFHALDIPYEVTPKVERCMMHSEGACWREYKFSFR